MHGCFPRLSTRAPNRQTPRLAVRRYRVAPLAPTRTAGRGKGSKQSIRGQNIVQSFSFGFLPAYLTNDICLVSENSPALIVYLEMDSEDSVSMPEASVHDQSRSRPFDTPTFVGRPSLHPCAPAVAGLSALPVSGKKFGVAPAVYFVVQQILTRERCARVHNRKSAQIVARDVLHAHNKNLRFLLEKQPVPGGIVMRCAKIAIDTAIGHHSLVLNSELLSNTALLRIRGTPCPHSVPGGRYPTAQVRRASRTSPGM